MINRRFALIVLSAALFIGGCNPASQTVDADGTKLKGTAEEGVQKDVLLALEPDEMDWVGQQIFHNECAGEFRCLVHWNDGEAFPSLGIGHFIWYPKGVDEPFVESFPKLIQYMVQRQASVPEWLRKLEPFDAPWPDKASFEAVENSVRVAELREFLAGTQGMQADFIVRRAQASFVKIVESVSEDRKAQLNADLDALSATPGGIYALVDYVNFKGEGLAEAERYNGEGWGLKQVLLAMEPDPEVTTLQRFREAAARVLTKRAENADSPIERTRWLKGWLKRLETYKEPDGVASPAADTAH
ncbi:hypothetical protein [Marinobacter sp.]|uniref:hypothetical protein n=1 Tax=Marinobacter sp. TaxID=50741 RepID=UPI003A903114